MMKRPASPPWTLRWRVPGLTVEGAPPGSPGVDDLFPEEEQRRYGRLLGMMATDLCQAAGALREAAEESGIAGLEMDPAPIGLDWHAVRCRNRAGVPAPSSHLDIEYVAVAPPGAEHMRSEEAPPFDLFEADSSRQPPPPGAAEGSTGKP